MDNSLLGNYKTTLEKVIVYGVLVLAVCIVVLTFCFEYWLISRLLPWWLSLMFVLLTIYSLILLVCRFLVFPGSFWLWRRSVEVSFGVQIAKRALARVNVLEKTVKRLHAPSKESGNDDEVFAVNNFQEAVKFLDDIKKSVEACEMSKYQRRFVTNVNAFVQNLKRTDGTVHASVYQLLQDHRSFVLALEEKKQIIDEATEKTLIQDLKNIETDLMDLSEPKQGKFQRLKQWLFCDTIGTANYFRAELLRRFRSCSVQFKSYDKSRIDGIMIFGDQGSGNSLYERQSADDSAQVPKHLPTIIFCNPNAGYYEFLYYSTDWIEFYVKHRINLVLWNYRGYSNSAGQPTPAKVCADAERLVHHLREKFGLKWIGIHGESLGGMVSSHTAHRAKLDFVFSDRTFNSLSDVAMFSLGRSFSILLRIATDWDRSLARSFSSARCYKLIGYDPRDQVIPFLAQLQNGMSRDVVAAADSLEKALSKHQAHAHQLQLQDTHLPADSKVQRQNAVAPPLDVYHYYHTQQDEDEDEENDAKNQNNNSREPEERKSQSAPPINSGARPAPAKTSTGAQKSVLKRCTRWVQKRKAYYKALFAKDERTARGATRVLGARDQERVFASLRDIVKLIRDIDKHNNENAQNQQAQGVQLQERLAPNDDANGGSDNANGNSAQKERDKKRQQQQQQQTSETLKKTYQGTPANKFRKQLEISFQNTFNPRNALEMDIHEPLFGSDAHQALSLLRTDKKGAMSASADSGAGNTTFLNDSHEIMVAAASNAGSGSGGNGGNGSVSSNSSGSNSPDFMLSNNGGANDDARTREGRSSIESPEVVVVVAANAADTYDRYSYEDLLSDDIKNSEDLLNFLHNVLQLLDIVDAGGVTLSDVFLYFQDEQLLVFQQFLVNIQVFGSVLPQAQVCFRKMDVMMCRKFAIMKLKRFVREMSKIINEQRNNTHSDDLKKKILSDLECIKRGIHAVHDNLVSQFEAAENSQKLQQHQQQQQQQLQQQQQQQQLQQKSATENYHTTQSVTGDEPARLTLKNGASGGTSGVDKTPPRKTTHHNQIHVEMREKLQQGDQADNEEVIERAKGQEPAIEKCLRDNTDHKGALILLDCGHNGTFKHEELRVYEYHLSMAGFIREE